MFRPLTEEEGQNGAHGARAAFVQFGHCRVPDKKLSGLSCGFLENEGGGGSRKLGGKAASNRGADKPRGAKIHPGRAIINEIHQTLLHHQVKRQNLLTKARGTVKQFLAFTSCHEIVARHGQAGRLAKTQSQTETHT
jgi:hypothetical protein